MSEVSRNLVCRVGVDLAKRVDQAHAVDGFEKRVLARAMSPERFFVMTAHKRQGDTERMEPQFIG